MDDRPELWRRRIAVFSQGPFMFRCGCGHMTAHQTHTDRDQAQADHRKEHQ